jgi:hypothetical protein
MVLARTASAHSALSLAYSALMELMRKAPSALAGRTEADRGGAQLSIISDGADGAQLSISSYDCTIKDSQGSVMLKFKDEASFRALSSENSFIRTVYKKNKKERLHEMD